MKQLSLIIFILSLTFSTYAQTPSFPGAGGGGMYVTGGRGGKVLYVTSLADDGTAGTLRWAINQTGARTILFKVSGLITLKSRLNITNGDLTIAGQSAPGDGICLKSYECCISANNIIIRYIRFRLGNEIIGNESDSFWGRYQRNIMIDHCSMSWSIDECASFYSNENFTMQWCILAESLNNAGHVKGAHGYGGLWGGKNASFHHNLIAHHNSRNPRFNGWKRSGLGYENPLDEERLDFRNNVIYNFGDNGSYGGESAGKYNIVANYIKYGPATKSSIKYKVTQVDIDASPTLNPPGFGQYYISDNYIYGSTSATSNNWSSVTYASGVDKTACVASAPFSIYPIAQHTATDAFERVLTYSGASLARDAVDTRVTTETRNGTATYNGSITLRAGIIDTQNDVGGWPTYNSTTAPSDTDADGIPDGWLTANYPGKTATDLNAEGYTYLEVYLNSLVGTITQEQQLGAVNTGLSELELNNRSAIQYQYNRASKELSLKAEDNITKVQLLDLTGRIVLIKTSNENTLTLNTQTLQTAIYILKVYTSKLNGITFKVIV